MRAPYAELMNVGEHRAEFASTTADAEPNSAKFGPNSVPFVDTNIVSVRASLDLVGTPV